MGTLRFVGDLTMAVLCAAALMQPSTWANDYLPAGLIIVAGLFLVDAALEVAG